MLSLKNVAINSFNENIVYLHKECEAYKVDDINELTRLEVHGGAEPLYAFLEIVEDSSIVAPDELGLNTKAFKQMNLPEGANVSVTLASTPASIASIKRKMSGSILSNSEYMAIVKDIETKT